LCGGSFEVDGAKEEGLAGGPKPKLLANDALYLYLN